MMTTAMEGASRAHGPGAGPGVAHRLGSTPGGAPMRVERATGAAEIAALSAEIDRLRAASGMVVANNDAERFLAATAGMGAAVSPYALVVRDASAVRAILLGRMSRRRVACPVGYASLKTPRMRCLDVVYGGLLTDGTAEAASELAGVVRAALAAGDADHVMVNHAPQSDPVAGLLRRGSHVPGPLSPHWRYTLDAGGYDRLAASWSSKHRSTLKRKDKALVEHFGGEVALRVFTGAEEIDEFTRRTAALASRTYQAALGAAFGDNDVWRNILRAEAARGRFRCYWLTARGEPIAFQIGFVYANVYMMESLGHDPDLSRLSPGMVLLHRVFRDLCAAGVSAYDYGFGDADYKKTYGTSSHDEATLRLYGRGLRARSALAMDRFAAWSSSRLAGLTAEAGAVAKIKRAWRDRLSAGRGKATRAGGAAGESPDSETSRQRENDT